MLYLLFRVTSHVSFQYSGTTDMHRRLSWINSVQKMRSTRLMAIVNFEMDFSQKADIMDQNEKSGWLGTLLFMAYQKHNQTIEQLVCGSKFITSRKDLAFQINCQNLFPTKIFWFQFCSCKNQLDLTVQQKRNCNNINIRPPIVWNGRCVQPRSKTENHWLHLDVRSEVVTEMVAPPAGSGAQDDLRRRWELKVWMFLLLLYAGLMV